MNLINQGFRAGGTDTHYTPLWVTKELQSIFGGKPFLDPCPGTRGKISGSTIFEVYDGLNYNWHEVCEYSFVNPPYSSVSQWIDKASLEADQGHTSLWFTKLDYRTKWYEKLEGVAQYIRPVKGYVRFEREDFTQNNAATFQTCFVLFGKKSLALSGRVETAYANSFAKRF